MGLFEKMSYERAFTVLTSKSSSKGELQKAEKVMSDLSNSDPRKIPCMILCLVRRLDINTAYPLLIHEEKKESCPN